MGIAFYKIIYLCKLESLLFLSDNWNRLIYTENTKIMEIALETFTLIEGFVLCVAGISLTDRFTISMTSAS